MNTRDVVERENRRVLLVGGFEAREGRAMICQRFFVAALFAEDSADLIADHRGAAFVAVSLHLLQQLLVDVERALMIAERFVLNRHVVAQHPDHKPVVQVLRYRESTFEMGQRLAAIILLAINDRELGQREHYSFAVILFLADTKRDLRAVESSAVISERAIEVAENLVHERYAAFRAERLIQSERLLRGDQTCFVFVLPVSDDGGVQPRSGNSDRISNPLGNEPLQIGVTQSGVVVRACLRTKRFRTQGADEGVVNESLFLFQERVAFLI